MTTETDTESLAHRSAWRYSDGWHISVVRDVIENTPYVVLEVFRGVDGLMITQQIRLTPAAAEALNNALDEVLYGPPEEAAA